jgi:hypothetical protein
MNKNQFSKDNLMIKFKEKATQKEKSQPIIRTFIGG